LRGHPNNISCGTSTADLAAREAIHLFAKRTHSTGGSSSSTGTAIQASLSTPAHGLRFVAPDDGSLITAV